MHDRISDTFFLIAKYVILYISATFMFIYLRCKIYRWNIAPTCHPLSVIKHVIQLFKIYAEYVSEIA
jgi:hypothetical protein